MVFRKVFQARGSQFLFEIMRFSLKKHANFNNLNGEYEGLYPISDKILSIE